MLFYEKRRSNKKCGRECYPCRPANTSLLPRSERRGKREILGHVPKNAGPKRRRFYPGKDIRLRFYSHHERQKYLRLLRPADRVLLPIQGDRKQLQPMRKGDSLYLRGEENTGFPLQTHGGNPEVGTVDKAGGGPDKRIS